MPSLLKQKAVVFAVAWGCLVFAAPRTWGADAPALKVGAAKVDITPKDLTGLIGIPNRPIGGVHDPIYARALLLDNSVTSVAIVELDLVEEGDTTAVRQRVQKELGIPVDHIVIAATHDHSAPRSGPPTPGTSTAIDGRPASTPEYDKQVDDAVVEVLRQAKAALQPARFGFGNGKVSINVQRYIYTARGWQSNSSNEDGYADPNVWVLKFETLTGTPIAVLMNYAVHSNSMVGTPGLMITGDIAGMAENYVERHLKNNVVALFSMGAAADQYPKFNWDRTDPSTTYEPAELQGGMLGEEVLQVASGMKDLSPTASIEAAERAVPCEMTPQAPPRAPGGPGPGGPDGANAGGPQGGPGGPPPGGQQHKGPMPFVTPGEKLDIHMSLIRINDIVITSVSGEVFTGIYEHLKKVSPFKNTMMITIANDRDGYIPDEAHWDEQGAAFVRGCAENVIVNNLSEMINATLP